MLHLKTTVITRGLFALPPKRALTKAFKPMWLQVGHFWHKHLLPKHFTEAGGREYGYRPRGVRYKRKHSADVMYDEWKQQKYGHRDPLMVTGQLYSMVLSERRVTATSKGCKVRLRVPAYTWYKGQADELTRVSRIDRNLMKAEAKRALVAALKNLQLTGPVRKRRPSRAAA